MGTPKIMLTAFGFMTAISVVALLALLLRVDPAYADTGTKTALYLSIFVATSGITGWLFMAARSKLPRIRRPIRYFFWDAFRQGLLVGSIITISLMLQAGRHLNFLTVLLVVILAFGVEAYWTRQARA